MTPPLEIRLDLDDGLDRKVLTQLRARFLRLNQARLARACEGLSSRQQHVLKLLPLLMHVNHPLLPGYVSGTTPAGLSNFEPDASVLAEAQRLTRSFAYKPRHGNPPRPIHGLFLMGSLGSLAQAENSDMDVWVCHASGLSEDALDELRRKVVLLEAWADSLGAEAHLFLIEPERFAKGERESRLSSDDCGTTQHFLLLDEFYRTAIWLGGRTPMWWLVPVYEESRYTQYTRTLLDKRFVREGDVLDLGNLSHIPQGEYLGAGLWQLFKGIDSPYKSLLKLLLVEAYASEQGTARCLALEMKARVYAREPDLDELDPYQMVYRRLERYLLERNEPHRLELVRRALYLKVNRKLSSSRPRTQSWQRQVMAALVEQWGWTRPHLALLDSRSQWKVRQVLHERRSVVGELNFSYRFLQHLASATQAIRTVDRRDLNVLGRRLYAAFERRPGKVELSNPGIAPNLAEDTLTLVQSPNRKAPGETHWGVYHGTLNSTAWDNYAPIRRFRHLVELLTWGHRNGIIDAGTRLALHPGSSEVTEYELFNLLGSLQQSFPLPFALVPEIPLLRSSRPVEVLVLVNVGIDPLAHHRDLNILMTTGRTDPLSFAGKRENLVLTFDRVMHNSWNEMFVEHFDGPRALLDALADYIHGARPGAQPPRLSVRSFCHNRAQAIAQRVEELFHKAWELAASGLGHRYLIQVEQRFLALDMQPDGSAKPLTFDDFAQLQQYLSQPLTRYSPITLDSNALQEHDLSLLLPMAMPDTLQVFYRISEGMADVYVLDEHNALWQQRQPYFDEASLLAPLARFLTAYSYRREARSALDDSPANSLQTLFYRLMPEGQGRARLLEPRTAPAQLASQAFYPVQAIVEGTQGHLTLYCNQREFSSLELGDRVFAEVATQILEQRKDGQRYRAYITDLDLPGHDEAQACAASLWLTCKTELEEKLNAALGRL